MNLLTAHNQWANRPDDERFTNLTDLKAAVAGRKFWSTDRDIDTGDIQAESTGDGLGFRVGDETLVPSNWAFQQVARLAGAPAGYLGSLPPHLAAQCINSGLKSAPREQIKVLKSDFKQSYNPAYKEMRAATSTGYGRIWDADVIDRIQTMNEQTGNRFFNPKEWSGTPGGLYASDRDVFVFMIDGGSLVDGGGERDQLHRGFCAWNSEVGKTTFGLQTFLFRAVCGNHIIWGCENFKEIKIRHTSGGPLRFEQQAAAELQKYVTASTAGLEAGIRKAKAIVLPKERLDLINLYATRKSSLSRNEVDSGIDAATKEEGKCENLWELVQGLTAHARGIGWTDGRVDLERRAGALLDAAK